jgi:arabinofuranan 3-O-arabinosyltransferase
VPPASPGTGPRLVPGSGRACARSELPDTGTTVLRVGLSYRSTGAAVPRICLWQSRPGRCAALPPVRTRAADGWHRYVAIARVGPGARRLLVYADGRGGHVDYRDVRVDGLRRAGGASLRPGAAPAVSRWLAAGTHELKVRGWRGRTTPSTPDLRDCDRVPADHPPHWSAVRYGDEFTLTGASGVGCVRADLGRPDHGAPYRVELDYRTVSGRPARICLWQEGPNRCADLPVLEKQARWRHLSAVVAPAAGTRRLHLYLFVDGQPVRSTAVSYRAVRVTPDVSSEVRVRDTRRAGPAPALASTGGGEHYRVVVTGATGGFVLALAESYASGWRISGLPPGWRARHVTVDGYANGWVIEGSGAAELSLDYAPGRWARGAATVSAATLAAAVLASVLLRARRRPSPGDVEEERDAPR